MLISIPAFLFYLLIIGPTRAQVGAPNCTDSTFAWSYNSLQQNPCWVSAYLEATCNNGCQWVHLWRIAYDFINACSVLCPSFASRTFIWWAKSR
ncbi:hypothetical protein EDB85DRAFT_1943629 [Lactarius pseudohatsudake]|nr:hypothetical protein EDB85DRAFT_1943629 [Lactarius pseudohatsudake]